MLELCSFFPIEILFCNPISLLLQTLHGWIRDYRLHWYDAFLCSAKGIGWKMVLQRSLGCAVTMAALNESGTIVFIGNESEVVKVVNLASGEVTEVTTNCQRALVRVDLLSNMQSLVPFELGDQEMLVVTSSSSISVIDVKMNKRLRITMEVGIADPVNS